MAITLPANMEADLKDDDEIIEAPKDKQPPANGARRRPTEPVTAVDVQSKPIGGLKSAIGSGRTDLPQNVQANLKAGFYARKVPTKRQAGPKPVERSSNPQRPTTDGDSTLTNPRHEQIAQALAAGLPQGEACKRAGYNGDRGASSRICANASIRQRVSSLVAERSKKIADAEIGAIRETGLTKQSVIEKLLDEYTKASASGHHAAAIRAAELLGKEIGMFVERKETGKPGDFTARVLSDEELDRQIAEELAKMKSAGKA